MNELNQLTQFRAEVPARETLRTQEVFYAGLRSGAAKRASSRSWLTMPKLALAGGLAVAAGAAAVVAIAPGSTPAGHQAASPAFTARAAGSPTAASPAASSAGPSAGGVPEDVSALALKASAAALTYHRQVAASQWLYVKLTHLTGGASQTEGSWQRADNGATASIDLGRDRTYQGLPVPVSLAQLSQLPGNPKSLAAAVFAKEKSWDQTFEGLINLESAYYNMPASRAAEIISAFQYIPGIQVTTEYGYVAFKLNGDPAGSNSFGEVLFDSSTYRLAGITRSLGGQVTTTLQAPAVPVSGPFVTP